MHRKIPFQFPKLNLKTFSVAKNFPNKFGKNEKRIFNVSHLPIQRNSCCTHLVYLGSVCELFYEETLEFFDLSSNFGNEMGKAIKLVSFFLPSEILKVFKCL